MATRVRRPERLCTPVQAPGRPHPRTVRRLDGSTVALLGSTGFLGRNLGSGFAARGANVVHVSRSAQVARQDAPGITVRLDLLEATPARIAQTLGSFRVDVVVNATGRVWAVGRQSGTDDPLMWAGNAELVTRLVEALTIMRPRPRFVQLGSVHEYGPGVPGTAIRENHDPAPVTTYGRAKLAGTRTVLGAVHSVGLDGAVLRVANVVGPGAPMGSLFGMVASHLAEAAAVHACGRRPEPLRLPPLRVYRDIVDMRDVVAAVCATTAASPATVSGQVINIGSGRAVPVRDVVERMIQLSGLPVPLLERPAHGPARVDVAWQQLDISRARRSLGWQPRHSLDDSLRVLLAAAALARPVGNTRHG